MNNQEKYQDDLLRQYINPEKTEKAPEGFTSKVMNRIQMEPTSSAVVTGSIKRNLVPVISIAVTVLLIVAAFLMPGEKTDPLSLQVLNLLKNVKSAIPSVDLSFLIKLNFPTVMIYVSVGIFVLSFFDRALYMIFHREKEK
jgi:hypothetical protein